MLCYDARRAIKLMDFKKRKPPLMLILVTALLALLPLLAVLQYHWLGEVSKGAQERMKENLRLSASQFGQYFDREVKNIYVGFQDVAIQFGEGADREMSERYRRWQASADHPRLIGEIYQAQMGNDGNNTLVRFVPGVGRFEPSEWPEKLAHFRKTLENQRKAQEAARMFFQGMLNQNSSIQLHQGVGGSVLQISLGPVDNEITGIVIPLLPVSGLDSNVNFDLPFHQSYRIVMLDQDYIKQELIPELVRRFFSNEGKLDYYVSVIDRENPQRTIYQSDPDQPANLLTKNDVSDTFFRVRLGDFDRMMIAGGLAGEGNKAGESKSERRRVAVSVIQSQINSSGNEKTPGLNGPH